MRDEAKTKDQLIIELKALRRCIAESEKDKGTSTDPAESHSRVEARPKVTKTETDQRETNDTERLHQELAAHRIKLEMQNEELRNALVQIEESRTRYADIYDFAPVGYLTLDGNGLVLEANLTIARRLGIERSRLLGRPLSAYIVIADRNAFRSHLDKVLKDKTHQDCEVRFVKDGGGDFNALLDTIFMMDAVAERRIRTSVSDITERKRTEEILRLRESYLTAFLENQPGLVWLKDKESRFLAVNQTFARSCGVERPEEVLGKTDLDIWPRELAEKYKNDDKAVMTTGVPIAVEESINDRGEMKWFETFKTPVLNEDGQILGTSGYARDITERKNSEKALHESELRLRTILQTVNEGFWLIDNDTVTIDLNPRMCAILGRSREEVFERKIFDFVDSENKAIFEQQMRLRAQGEAGTYEIALSRPDGSKVFCLFNATPLSGGSGNKVGSFAMVTDITERTKQTREIERLNRLYSVLSRVSQAVVRATSPEKFLEQACREIVEGGGFLLAWIGKVEVMTNAVVPAALWGEIGEYIQGITVHTDSRPEGRGPTGTCIHRHSPIVHNDFLHDPQTSPWHDRAAPFGIAAAAAFPIERAGGVWGALTIYSDEVDRFSSEDVKLLEKVAGDIGFALDNLDREFRRKRAEEALLLSEGRYRRLFEDAVLGIFRATPGGKLINVNPAYARMYGFDSPEEAKRQVNDVAVDLYVDPSHRDEIVRMILDAREPVHAEILYRRKDGSIFPGNLHAWAVRDRERNLLYLEGFVEDITDRKRAEEEKEILEAELRRVQKLEAIGTLAGGIAHDFNNILQPMMGYTEMALNELSPSSPLRNDLEMVLKASLRAKELIRQILAISRSTEEQHRIPTDISSIIKEALKLLRSALPASIEIRENIRSGVALADPTQIHQVLMNLCTNAAHAMGNKGILEVRMSPVKLSESQLAAQSIVDLKPGPYLRLTVSDTGCGMDAKTMERIFDPYFTTKEVGKGSGLGLSVINGIVKRHEGTITVRSKPGKGTTFSVYIPKVDVRAEATMQVDDPLPRGSERILIVDDEPAVMKMATRLLARLGYKVTGQTDSVSALEVFRSNPNEFDLIITDHAMPKLTGLDFAREVLRARPDMPILLCTGFSEKITPDSVKELGTKLLMKPYGAREISEVIRKILDARKGG